MSKEDDHELIMKMAIKYMEMSKQWENERVHDFIFIAMMDVYSVFVEKRMSPDKIEFSKMPERFQIIQVLTNSGGPVASGDIARALDKKPSAVSNLLTKMVIDNSIVKVSTGKYQLG